MQETNGRNLFECHGHIMMDGDNYLQAKSRHRNGVDIAAVRKELAALRDAGISFFRDGGDALRVSETARKIAPEYGIEYLSPLFAIYKKGYYGGIVGYSYTDLDEYRTLVRKVREGGGDFVKIMISGIITFKSYGELSCPHLPEKETETLVSIAHDAGYPVMIHVNGDAAIRAAVRAGADSIEHGVFMEEETAEMLAESKTVWVPTAAAIAAFTNRDGTDRAVAQKTLDQHLSMIRKAAGMGARIAAGSDSGAAGVPHGTGTLSEYSLLKSAGVADGTIREGSGLIRSLFAGNGC